MTENELKQLVVALARRNGWAVYFVTQQKHHNGSGSGYPDLTCARDGEVVWLELKQDAGKPTADQVFWAEALGRSCHLVRPRDWDSGRVAELLR